MCRARAVLAVLLLNSSWALAQIDSEDPTRRAFVITAKIYLEDGAAMTSSPLVYLRVPGHDDYCVGQELFANGTLRLRVPPNVIQGQPQLGCHISVILSGYVSFTGYVADGTVITLRREGPRESSTASVASLDVPREARKLYDSGEGAASHKKWAKAETQFRAAVQIYPQYALAWSELGRVLQEQERFDDAAAALNQARRADPGYPKPMVQLAGLSGLQHRWEDELRFSEEAIKVQPVGYPSAYYYKAEAIFHLGNLHEAESLTRKALSLDPGASCPELLVLLGQIFEKQGNTHDALIEYRNYLELAPHGPQAALARESITRLQ